MNIQYSQSRTTTDGSALGNPDLAGAGGLLRHSDGSWFRGFTRNIGITSSFVVELLGVRDGLRLAKPYNIQKLIIELDAKAMLDLLMSDNNTFLCYHPLSALINDCRSLIHSFEEARLLHTYCEGNFCADLLAREGTKTANSYVEYFSPPSFIVNQLMANMWGVSFCVYSKDPEILSLGCFLFLAPLCIDQSNWAHGHQNEAHILLPFNNFVFFVILKITSLDRD